MRDRERNPHATRVLTSSTRATFEHCTLEDGRRASWASRRAPRRSDATERIYPVICAIDV